jgi:cell division protein FtsN
MDRNTMMMVAIGALILAVLYLYRENQKLKGPATVVSDDSTTGAWGPPPAKKKKVVSFEDDEKAVEKSVPVESE